MDINNRQYSIFVIISSYLVLILIVFMLTLSQAGRVQIEFPQLTNCESIEAGFTSQDNFKEFATIDKEPTLNLQGHGIYQCYCKKYSSKKVDLVDTSSFCYSYQYDMDVGEM